MFKAINNNTLNTFIKLLRTYTLLGTTEYLSPEVIEGKGYGLAADWWALGILVFEMAVGYPPFFGKNPFTVYKKILECKPPYPSSLPSSTKAVIAGFLTVSRTRRLGWVSANPAAVTSTITTTTTTDLLQALKRIF